MPEEEGGRDSKKSKRDPSLSGVPLHYSNYDTKVSPFHLEPYGLRSALMCVAFVLDNTMRKLSKAQCGGAWQVVSIR